MLRQSARSSFVCLALFLSLATFGCGGSSAPVSLTVTASSGTVDGADTVTLSATVTNDHNSAGVSWAVSGGGTLSNTTTTSATYTAPSATSTAQTATITATSIADATKTQTATLTIPAAPAVTSTSTGITGSVGSTYSVTLAASGGISPYTWSLGSGTTLPSCLTLKSSGVLTTTSGLAPTASCAGVYSNLTFKATDAGTPTPLSVTSSPLSITITAAPAITFTGVVPATGTYNATYSGSAAATGGAASLTYTLAGGAMPTGLLLNAASGAIAGTITAAGTFNFTIQAADAFGDSNTHSYQIIVGYPQLTVTTGTTLPSGYGSALYMQNLAASGGSGTGYTWNVTSGQSSLTALNLTLSSAGVLSGTPPVAGGSASFGVQVTDSSSNTATASLSLTIKPGVTITTATPLTAGYGNTPYSQPLAASGGSGSGYTWVVTSGASTLTALNLGLSSGGVLSGTPPVAGGSASFGVQVTDSSSNTATASFSLTINTGVSVAAPTLAAAYPGTAYASSPFTASGGSGTPFTWTIAAAAGSSVPAGFSIGSTSGILAATSPANSGSSNATYNVVITATDSLGNKGSANAAITIEPTLTISTPATLPGGTPSVLYSQPLAASGGSGTGYSWVTNGAGTTSLATLNLTLSSGGLVSGTPSGTGTATFSATVTDSQSHTSAPVVFSVTVSNALTINTTTLPATNVGSPYSQQLTASGGSGTGYTWTATASNLSTYGLSLSSAGLVAGTPTQNGTASFTAKVTDSNTNSTTQPLSITIDGALSLPTPNPVSLPSGYTGVTYSGSITGSGGSGNLSIAVVTGLPSDNLSATPAGATLNIGSGAGGPTSPTTVNFTVKLTDTTTGNFITQAYSIAIATPVAVALPSPSASIPGSATVNQTYSGSINASGGVGPYTWSINGTTVTSGGLSLGNGTLAAANSGGSTLTFSGTPTSTGTVTLTNVEVKDSESTPSTSTNTYSIQVNNSGQTVSGSINLSNTCGSVALPTFTVTINTSTPQQVQTDSNGNYTFNSIPNGTYTITPSIGGASSVFYPASYTGVVVNNSTVAGENFNAVVGYTVSGTVSYSGAHTGQIYLYLNSNNCGGQGQGGTSVAYPFTSGGAYTIRGVPPGSYSLQAWMDPNDSTSDGFNLAQGAPNTVDPTGSATANVNNANATGVAVPVSDNNPTAVPTGNPTFQAITPTATGVAISYSPVVATVNGNKVEAATFYSVQWESTTSPTCTTSSFSGTTGTHTIPAVGTKTNVWILNNSVVPSGFTSGTEYCFEARAYNSMGPSGWAVYPNSVTIGTPTCSGTCYTVSGAVTIASGTTPSGPLYAGVYNEDTGQVYALEIPSPTTGSASPNNFTVSNVPSGTSYFLFGILDQNNDGAIDAGDLSNVRNDNSSGISVTSSLTGQNVSLSGANSIAGVLTEFNQNTSNSPVSSNYQLYLTVQQNKKLPVAVTLASSTAASPYVLTPVDMGLCSSCGNAKFEYTVNVAGGTPAVGDSFNFTVTYSDGTQDTGSVVNGAVTAFGSTGAVTNASDAPASLLPSLTSTTNTQPNFTWTFPANPSNYTYSFYLSQNNCSGGNCTIWQLPGNNSNLNGFTYAQTQTGAATGQITWGTDPTGGGSSPSPTSLTVGDSYYWSLTVQDTNGNQAQTSVNFTP